MEERSLRVVGTDKTFFNKLTNTLTKILIPTQIGINGMRISMKRNALIKAYEIAESLMRTVKDVLPLVLKDPENYRYRAQIMWAGSLAHNDLTECGTEKDFATHRLEHELSALFGVTHGAGLAALWPSWARFVMDRHLNRFVQFAVNVMGVTNDFANPRQTALSGIEAVEKFYHEIGMPTSIHELLGREITEEELEVMVDKCSRGGKITVGAMEVLGQNEMREIYRMAR